MCEQLVRSTEKCAINFKRDKEFSAKSDDTPKITKQRTERKHWNRKSQLRRGRGLLHLSNYIYSYIDSTRIWELDFIESLYCCCWLLSLSLHIGFWFGFVCHLAHIKVISRIFWWIATKRRSSSHTQLLLRTWCMTMPKCQSALLCQYGIKRRWSVWSYKVRIHDTHERYIHGTVYIRR